MTVLDTMVGVLLKMFAVWEQAKGRWRAIDNGRPSGHNDAAEHNERIHTTSVDMGLAIVQRLLHLQFVMGEPRKYADMMHSGRLHEQICTRFSHSGCVPPVEEVLGHC